MTSHWQMGGGGSYGVATPPPFDFVREREREGGGGGEREGVEVALLFPDIVLLLFHSYVHSSIW